MKKVLLYFLFVSLTLSFVKAQWVEQNSTITTLLYSVSAVTDNTAWVSSTAGKVILTVNGGTTWANATGTGIPTSIDLFDIFGIDSMNALVTGGPTAGGNTFVYKTTNGGVSWTQVFSQTNGFIDGIWMTSSLNGIMYGDPVGNRWSLWKTLTGGLTWDSTGMYVPQVNGEAGWNNAIYSTGTSYWFVSNGGRIYYSNTGGLSWTPQATATASSGGFVWFNSTIGMSSGNAQLLMTTNNGTLWTNLSLPGTATIAGMTSAASGSNWWAVRQGNVIYKSTNNGSGWTTDYTSPTGTYTDIQRARNGNRIWAIKNDGTISKNDGITIGIKPISQEVPSVFSLHQNFPNPFNPSTNVRFDIPKESSVKLTVYDVTGREVQTLVNENLKAGVYSINFDANTLSSGVYFYKIYAGNYTDTKKMILVK